MYTVQECVAACALIKSLYDELCSVSDSLNFEEESTTTTCHCKSPYLFYEAGDPLLPCLTLQLCDATALLLTAFLLFFLMLPTHCSLITGSMHSDLWMAGLCLLLTHSVGLLGRLRLHTPQDWRRSKPS